MIKRCSQRRLVAIFEADAWLVALKSCKEFDAANAVYAALSHREATRLISNSQVGAGAFLLQNPDVTAPGTIRASVDVRIAAQRRLGLYLSDFDAVLNTLEQRGHVVTQHMRLGDFYINDSDTTRRHNAGLAAIASAFKCSSSGACTFKLGDKGDGSPGSAGRARERTAYLNATRIPDGWTTGSPPNLYEWKCYTCYNATGRSLGNGSDRLGGAASTTDGGDFAFGNTEELLRVLMLGVAARGDPSDPPFDRRTGTGRVKARAGAYADAQDKGHPVHLLVSETTGALSDTTVNLLKSLARIAKSDKGYDSTPYGQSPTSPHTFYAHHLAALSCAIVYEMTLTLRQSLAKEQRALATGAI